MEIRQELQLENPLIWNDLLRRMWKYAWGMLGDKTEENREVYENNQVELKRLLYEKKEYMVPEGSYLLSAKPHLSYERAEEAGVLAEYIVVFGLKEYRTEDVCEQYLMHLLQIGMMNAVRDHLKETLVPQLYRYIKNEKAPYISEFFGPGLFEEPLAASKDMVALTRVQSVSLSEKELLSPAMAFAGALYVTERETKKEMPCISCKAKRGCEYCMKKR